MFLSHQEKAMANRRKNDGPEKTIRLGNVSASVFVNETSNNGNGTNEFRSITVQRSYRDDKDNTRYDTSFTARDLPAAIRCLQLAQEYVEQQDVLV
jgi:hypothetical protein